MSDVTRYFLAQDGDCHWYIVPVDKHSEWETWNSLSEDNEDSWDVPVFAQAVGGSPRRVTFTDPKIDQF